MGGYPAGKGVLPRQVNTMRPPFSFPHKRWAHFCVSGEMATTKNTILKARKKVYGIFQ
jgi:hypothetical protein